MTARRLPNGNLITECEPCHRIEHGGRAGPIAGTPID